MSAVNPYADLVFPHDDLEPLDDYTGSSGPVGSVGSLSTVPVVGPVGPLGSVGYSGEVLNRVRTWLGRFICTVHDSDLDLLTLWAAHTHLCNETYTDWDAWSAVTKTTMARPAPQVAGFSNAGDSRSVVLASLRAKALATAADR